MGGNTCPWARDLLPAAKKRRSRRPARRRRAADTDRRTRNAASSATVIDIRAERKHVHPGGRGTGVAGGVWGGGYYFSRWGGECVMLSPLFFSSL